MNTRRTMARLALTLAFAGGCSLQCGTRAPEPKKASSSAGPADPALPGLGSGDPQLEEKLERALADKGPDYEPRTHHLEDDDSPTYTNRLILETSPYLLQHAHNPVNWHPWGDEAFERARREGKPVLLSVGYSTCHWCHVMERESFEDLEIARTINEHYIPIKVDREERPDVDAIYMKAVRMLTGGGGWPMTVMLTPDGEPFFGGTYFPARDGDRGARKGFLTILEELAAAYDRDRERIVERASTISRRIRSAAAPRRPGDVPGPAIIDRAARDLARSFDPVWGGFGGAPKFPSPPELELLLRYHRRTSDPQAEKMVTHTLERMAAGGLYDQLGGGFHRYSTDEKWLVPHFEKMLYDNAQLVPLYLAAYQLTKRERFARVARETLEYVARDMTAPGGGFYSATDADSPTPEGHDEEGWFFTWTLEDLQRLLEPEQTRLVRAYYGVTRRGNFEGRSILHRRRPDTEVAAELGVNVEELQTRLAKAEATLMDERDERPRPHRDEKILTAWNGLMISAYAKAALVLGEPGYADRAAKAASFVLRELRGDDGRLERSFVAGRARHDAYLDDYAFLIQGLLDLHEATSRPRWLETAIALQKVVDDHYRDDEAGGYFLTSDDHEDLLAREKPTRDGAKPSGNSVTLLNLLRLEELTSEPDYRKQAEAGLAAFSANLTRAPRASPTMLCALDFYLDEPLEVFVVAPRGVRDPESLLSVARTTFVPNRIFAAATEGAELERNAELVPLLRGKRALDGKATAYVCEKGHCELPTSDPEVFANQLDAVDPLLEDRDPLPVARAAAQN